MSQTPVPPTEQDNEALIKTIKAHLSKGEKADGKAKEHYLAAGLHLKTLKEQHQGTWTEWDALLKDRLGIGKSRASELMQIADGRKTVAEIQDAGAARKAKERALSVTSRRSATPSVTGELNRPALPAGDGLKPTHAPPGEARAPSCGTVDFPTPHAAHGIPAPGSEGHGAGVTLVPQDDAGAQVPPPPTEAGERIRELEIEVEELKAENAELRRELAVFKSPVRCEFVEDDGGRAAAGYEEAGGNCVARAIAIATGKPYAEVFEALKAKHASYVKRLRHDHYERRTRTEPVANGCSEKVFGPYLESLGWQYTRIRENLCLRAGALPSGRLIVGVHGHLVALIDDVIHDTHDSGGSGRRPVDGYWSRAAACAEPAHSDEAATHTATEISGR